MAYLWYHDEQEGWRAHPLAGESVELDGRGPVVAGSGPGPVAEATATLVRVEDGRLEETWAVLWGIRRKVRVNGVHEPTGFRLLADRDEIQVDDHDPLFYSAETPAKVETFPGSDREMFCPRCKKRIESGTPVVRCPACLVWYHTSEDKSHDCWGYSPNCQCGHPTAMDTDFLWTPEEAWQ